MDGVGSEDISRGRIASCTGSKNTARKAGREEMGEKIATAKEVRIASKQARSGRGMG